MGAARAKNRFYAYDAGGHRGIVKSWTDCEAKVRGRPARYRGFETLAAARAWLQAGAPYEDRSAAREQAREALPKHALYFDSGTGRGLGSEVAVTDAEGAPVLHLALPAEALTERGTHLLPAGKTNNYGELFGCLCALRAARKLGLRAVCGDSALVLDYWSKGHVTKEKRESDPDLYALAQKTFGERRLFEAKGGRLIKVPGSLNPADLGFHRE